MKKGLLGRNPIECLLLGRFDSFRSTTTTTRVNKRKRGKRKLHWSVLLLFSSRLVLYNKGQHWHPKCRRHWKQFDWSLLFVSFSLLRLSVVLYLSDDIVYSLCSCSEWSKKRKTLAMILLLTSRDRGPGTTRDISLFDKMPTRFIRLLLLCSLVFIGGGQAAKLSATSTEPPGK